MTTVDAPGNREAMIRSILDDLFAQRKRMESVPAEEGLLEANRLAIKYWEWQLSRCLMSQRTQRSGAQERAAPDGPRTAVTS
jgi:hypothetical protein